MKYDIVPNSCRVCLRKSSKMRSIFKALDEGDETPCTMLEHITGICLEEERTGEALVNLPKNICKNCELSLNLASQFRQKALRSQKILEIFCSHELQKVSEENLVCESSHSESSVKDELINQYIEQHESLQEVCIEVDELDCLKRMKVEHLEVQYSDVESCVQGESDIDKIEFEEVKEEFLDEDFLDFNDEINDGSNDTFDGNSEQRFEYENSESTDEISHRKRQCSPSQNDERVDKESGLFVTPAKRGRRPKTLNNRAKPKLRKTSEDFAAERSTTIKAKRANAEQNSHICDICGNIYAKRGRMMEHRRRHNKELRFACELCDKKFHMREKLRRHMFSHSGGRPFKCSFCSRTFFYESIRKSHEAIHQGHKPYICNVKDCKKAFAYSQALKKHKLIHANIKLYHCKYCDKDFRLQHHMKQHEETKMHQNAVNAAHTDNF